MLHIIALLAEVLHLIMATLMPCLVCPALKNLRHTAFKERPARQCAGPGVKTTFTMPPKGGDVPDPVVRYQQKQTLPDAVPHNITEYPAILFQALCADSEPGLFNGDFLECTYISGDFL